MNTKICNKCGKEKSVDAFPRVKGKNGKVYHRKTCKVCRRNYERNWRGENIKHVKQWRKKHYQENREEIIAHVAKWQSENREHKLAYQREWYLLNQDELLAKQKEWYEANPEKVAEYVEKNRGGSQRE